MSKATGYKTKHRNHLFFYMLAVNNQILKEVTRTSLSCYWFKGKHVQSLTIKYDVSWKIFINLYYFEDVFFYSQFAESFHQKWKLDFVRCFFFIYWDDHFFSFFQSVNMMNYINFYILSQFYNFGINLPWSRCVPFDILLD